jgi:ubiquinone/menaquinone biosynthesis C-methylase UbiE
MTVRDRWSRWLLEQRFGGDAEAEERGMSQLRSIRDRVLQKAQLGPDMTLLDVGAGDGLIAFGALDRVGETGHVIFSDVSQPLLDHCRAIAADIGVLDRCSFVRAAADDLSPITDGSVDAVTTRSVLIYVANKAAAFREFHRVLRPGGRVALFEPINREVFERQWPGGDVEPVKDLAQRLRAFYLQLQPPETSPMVNFDERDLVRLSEASGFKNVHLEFHVILMSNPPQKWETFINSPGNPTIPSFADAMKQVFTADEIRRLETHVRPRVESGGGQGASAVAYLRATKDDTPAKERDNA